MWLILKFSTEDVPILKYQINFILDERSKTCIKSVTMLLMTLISWWHLNVSDRANTAVRYIFWISMSDAFVKWMRIMMVKIANFISKISKLSLTTIPSTAFVNNNMINYSDQNNKLLLITIDNFCRDFYSCWTTGHWPGNCYSRVKDMKWVCILDSSGKI